MYYKEIIDIINTGIVILDRHYKVLGWNRWMSIFSKIEKEKILNTSLFNHFPDLNNPSFLKVCKSVFTFGNIIYLSQKIHNYIFPFKVVGSYASHFEYMQQSCNIAPLKNAEGEIEAIVISITDVTESVIVEQKLRNMNSTDELTGTYNRRYFEGKLKEEFFRLKRYELSLSMIMFDIDYFKTLNDTHGHPFGDHVLRELSQRIKGLIRDVDILVRYGGDEFICLLPETALAGTEILAERIRGAIGETLFSLEKESQKVTLSLGIAEAKADMAHPDELVMAADKALYLAKDAGRNCVRTYTADAAPARRKTD